MKAAVHRNGTVHITEIEKPVPGEGEVLVRVHASTICAADYRMAGVFRFAPLEALVRAIKRKPTIFGMELSGTVDAVGSGVTKFRVGDQVFGSTGFWFGAHAEYALAREYALALKPDKMALEDAAGISFGALSALCFLRWCKVDEGQNVLIYGASGAIGVFAVQLAKHWGARVTAVCSTSNVEMVRSLGADRVIDYTREDFSKDGRIYDVIIDTVGKSGFWRSLKVLKRGHRYGICAPSGGIPSILLDMPQQWWISLTGAAKVIGGVVKPQRGDVQLMKELIDAGVVRTVIDRRYSLEQVGEAIRYAEKGHKKGHVIIQVAG